jgi:hypothetical protein
LEGEGFAGKSGGGIGRGQNPPNPRDWETRKVESGGGGDCEGGAAQEIAGFGVVDWRFPLLDSEETRKRGVLHELENGWETNKGSRS